MFLESAKYDHKSGLGTPLMKLAFKAPGHRSFLDFSPKLDPTSLLDSFVLKHWKGLYW